MNQKQLLHEVRTTCGCTHDEAKLFLRAFQRAIAIGLANDTQVKLPGLGVFKLERSAVKFHNIVTKQLETSPVRPRIKFKAGVALKTALEVSNSAAAPSVKLAAVVASKPAKAVKAAPKTSQK